MSLHLQATRLSGFRWAGVICLALAVQSQTQTGHSSQNTLVEKQKQVAPPPVVVDIPTVNYSRDSKNKVEFTPTNLMPGARGQGQVKPSKEGGVSVDLQFSGLESPTTLGNQFLTYVLWGSVPTGRTLKIGELSLEGNRGRVAATTVLRTFAMMVTAEPYSVVTHPSSIVILKGSSSMSGAAQTAIAKVELLDDAYAPPGYTYEPLDTNSGYPPEIIQAMNARRIAKVMGAEKYAPSNFRAAENLYQYMTAVAIQEKKVSKQTLGVANSVAQSYEDARALSIRNQQDRK